MTLLGSTPLLLVLVAIFTIAVLYSAVGHGGGSGYIAIMALCSLPMSVVKPTSLLLNILVALLAVYAYTRAGHFRWEVFWPFAATSIPFSFFGGAITLPSNYLKPVLGVILICAAWRLISTGVQQGETVQPSFATALIIGASLGFLSGLTGVGGGIFLSPILLYCRWAEPREASGIAALFILVNSVAGLLGHVASLGNVPSSIYWLALAAIFGGMLGSSLGSRVLSTRLILRALSIVLVVAGGKLVLV